MSLMSAPAQKRRRWFQFRLRSLLILVAVTAVALAAFRIWVEPYRRQQAAISVIKDLGGTFKTEASDVWLRRWFGAERIFGYELQDLVVVDLADCEEPHAYLNHIRRLPALRTLVVGRDSFTDEHLDSLRELISLKWLVLDYTSVTNDGIAELMQALPHLQVHLSERRARRFFSTEDVVISPIDEQLAADVDQEHFLVAKYAFAWGPYLFEPGSATARGESEKLIRYAAHLRHLDSLMLTHLSLSEHALSPLVGSETLRQLSIHASKLDGDAIASFRSLKGLTDLDLRACDLAESGVHHLSELKSLKRLSLEMTGVSAEMIQQLCRSLPRTTIGAPIDPKAAEAAARPQP